MWLRATGVCVADTALTPLIKNAGMLFILSMNLLDCFGSNGVKNISFEFNIGMFFKLSYLISVNKYNIFVELIYFSYIYQRNNV
jgi:hypothetical protein